MTTCIGIQGNNGYMYWDSRFKWLHVLGFMVTMVTCIEIQGFINKFSSWICMKYLPLDVKQQSINQSINLYHFSIRKHSMSYLSLN